MKAYLREAKSFLLEVITPATALFVVLIGIGMMLLDVTRGCSG